jgi:hypothetical protein
MRHAETARSSEPPGQSDLGLIDRQSRSTKTLSRQEPLPSMLMAMPAFSSTLVKSRLVLRSLIGVDDLVQRLL